MTKAEKIDFLPLARRKQIIDHLEALQGDAQSSAIEAIIQNGGEEARFLTVLLGKDEAGHKDAPRNKKLSPPEMV